MRLDARRITAPGEDEVEVVEDDWERVVRVEFEQCGSHPGRFVLRVPVGSADAEVRRVMDRKGAEKLMAQMVFVLGYKLELTS